MGPFAGRPPNGDIRGRRFTCSAAHTGEHCGNALFDQKSLVKQMLRRAIGGGEKTTLRCATTRSSFRWVRAEHRGAVPGIGTAQRHRADRFLEAFRDGRSNNQ